MSRIINIVTVRIFKVMFDKYNVDRKLYFSNTFSENRR